MEEEVVRNKCNKIDWPIRSRETEKIRTILRQREEEIIIVIVAGGLKRTNTRRKNREKEEEEEEEEEERSAGAVVKRTVHAPEKLFTPTRLARFSSQAFSSLVLFPPSLTRHSALARVVAAGDIASRVDRIASQTRAAGRFLVSIARVVCVDDRDARAEGRRCIQSDEEGQLFSRRADGGRISPTALRLQLSSRRRGSDDVRGAR